MVPLPVITMLCKAARECWGRVGSSTRGRPSPRQTTAWSRWRDLADLLAQVLQVRELFAGIQWRVLLVSCQASSIPRCILCIYHWWKVGHRLLRCFQNGGPRKVCISRMALSQLHSSPWISPRKLRCFEAWSLQKFGWKMAEKKQEMTHQET